MVPYTATMCRAYAWCCTLCRGCDVLLSLLTFPVWRARQKWVTDTMSAEAPDTSGDSKAKKLPPPAKKKPEDFIFGKVIGEGSYSTVSGPALCLCSWPLNTLPTLGAFSFFQDLKLGSKWKKLPLFFGGCFIYLFFKYFRLFLPRRSAQRRNMQVGQHNHYLPHLWPCGQWASVLKLQKLSHSSGNADSVIFPFQLISQ